MSISYLHTPQFLIDALDVMTCIEIPFHLLGFYCILFKTPDSMKSVKWIMLNFLIWSVLLDLGVTVLTSPFLLFPTFSGYPLGVLKYIGVPTSVQTYGIVMVYAMLVTSILTLFENRYYLMFARYNSWGKYRTWFLFGNYFLSSIFFIPAYITIPEQSSGLQEVFKILPKLPTVIMEAPLFVLATDLRIVFLSVQSMALLLCTESVFFVVLLQRKLKMRARKMSTSPYTLNLQKQFLRAIYIQVCTPFLILVTPLTYTFFSVVFNYYNQAANNFCSIFFSLHGLISTLTFLLIHKSYRKACFEIFTFFISNQPTTSSIVVPSSSTRIPPSKVKTLFLFLIKK
uniref:Serpentine Receptor, class H n=1 Tax=Caenorhabditis tropicalis TaxID=1561998 RepID=A0A1I7V1J3_9PELO